MPTSRSSLRRLLLLGAGFSIVPGSVAMADELYSCVLQPVSTLSYSVSASAPLSGTFKGADTTAVPPALATRTKTPPANFLVCGIVAMENDDVPYTGTGAVSGSGSNLHPTGTFRLGFDTVDNTAFVDSGSFNLLGGATGVASSQITSLTAAAFCAVSPSCQVPISLSFNLPLGDATITSVLAVQGGAGTGTITPTGVDTWDYSVAVTLDVTPTVIFNAAPLDVGTQTIPAVITGSITRNGAGITATSTLNLNINQTNMTPVPITPTPVNVTGAPLCNGMNLILSGTITSQSLGFTSNAALTSAGTRVPCACDFDASGGVSVNDLFAFLAAWFAQNGQTAPALTADFDHSGSVSVNDLFEFLSCWFGQPGNLGC